MSIVDITVTAENTAQPASPADVLAALRAAAGACLSQLTANRIVLPRPR